MKFLGLLVQVINLVSERTIEHRMLFTLNFKSALAEAVLDATEKDVFMDKSRFEEFMERLEVVNGTEVGAVEEPAAETGVAAEEEDLERPTAAADPDAPDTAATLTEEWWENTEEEAEEPSPTPASAANPSGSGRRETNSAAPAASQLVADGLSFLGRLTQTLSNPQATEQLVDSLVRKDERTGETYLKIPVDGEDVVRNGLKLLSGLLKNLG